MITQLKDKRNNFVMSFSNLSLEVLNSVVSTATEKDCELLLSSIKKRRTEIDCKEHYALIEIDQSYTWRKPYKPQIYFDVECASSELPEKIFNALNKHIESYDDDYHYILWEIAMNKQFVNVRGIQSDALRDMMNSGLLTNENDNGVDGGKPVGFDISKGYFKQFGLKLFTEIHQSVGLMNLFDEFDMHCGVLCLLKQGKTLTKLKRNGLPWDSP